MGCWFGMVGAALLALGCNLYEKDDDCPCPSDYQCCEGQGFCVPAGSSCDLPPSGGTTPPPQGLPDASVSPSEPSPGTPLAFGTCCEGDCSPVACDGWAFDEVGFSTLSEARAALQGDWQGFRNVPAAWDGDDKGVELSFGEATYVSDCLPAWCSSALYWGIDGRGESLAYELWDISPGGPLEGQLTVYMGGQMVGDPLYDTGVARFELDGSRTRMRIWFTRSWGQSPPDVPAAVYLQKVPE